MGSIIPKLHTQLTNKDIESATEYRRTATLLQELTCRREHLTLACVDQRNYNQRRMIVVVEQINDNGSVNVRCILTDRKYTFQIADLKQLSVSELLVAFRGM